jgi:hypothetical protein
VVGTARLPRTLVGEQSGPLIIELAYDAETRQVVDVATTLQLPMYQQLLRRLVGSKLQELEAATSLIFTNYRGPLFRPTLAAIANALANTQDAAPRASLSA